MDEVNDESEKADKHFPRRCCGDCCESECCKKCNEENNCSKVVYNACCPCEQIFCATNNDYKRCKKGCCNAATCGLYSCCCEDKTEDENTETDEGCCSPNAGGSKKGLMAKCRCCTSDYFQDRTKEKTAAMFMGLFWSALTLGGSVLLANGTYATKYKGEMEFSEEQMPMRFTRDIANEWEANFAFACFGCAVFSLLVALVYCCWACHCQKRRLCCGRQKQSTIPLYVD